MRRFHSVSVEVDVDMSDIDTSDLIEELKERNRMPADAAKSDGIPPLSSDEPHPLHEIYYAFKFGMNDRANDLTRAYVCDQLGVVL